MRSSYMRDSSACCRFSGTWKGQVAWEFGREKTRCSAAVDTGKEWRCNPRVSVSWVTLSCGMAMWKALRALQEAT